MRVHAIIALILLGPLLGGCEALFYGPFVIIDLTATGLSYLGKGIAAANNANERGPYSAQGFYHANDTSTAKKTCTDAVAGNVEARHALGEFHEQGSALFPRDFVEAWKWYSLSEEAGLYEAEKSRYRIAYRMTAEEIAEAKRRAAAWTPAEPCPPLLPEQVSSSVDRSMMHRLDTLA